ncbi:phosphoadenosine phosphosulfate reductase domain-containing protein [Enterobacter hormaechei]
MGQGVQGIEKDKEIDKVEPMNRALKELNAQTWFAGLRREQSGSRNAAVLAVQHSVFKCCRSSTGITARGTKYLQKHGLKYHPRRNQGASVGGRHPHHA